MTYVASARYSLPLDITRRPLMGTPPVDPSAISVVVPVKDDMPGLIRTLCSLQRMKRRPREIRVIDDGSQNPVTIRSIQRVIGCPLMSVSVRRLSRNRGPAFARNEGLKGVSGWIYLTDCGCTHPEELFDELASAREMSEDHTTAIATPIASTGHGRVNRYMTEQGNLNPPMIDGMPQAIITASALVFGPAAERIGWFDHLFREAGGEDIDFGIRLGEIGHIQWCPAAVVLHDFQESVTDFDSRFQRYGRGLRTLATKWGVSLKPFEFDGYSPHLQDLASRQYRQMLSGYSNL